MLLELVASVRQTASTLAAKEQKDPYNKLHERELATRRRRDERPERVEVPRELLLRQSSSELRAEQPQIVPPFIHDRRQRAQLP